MIANELKNNLMKEYPYRIEMHAHTKPVSFCSEITPEEIVDIYSKKGYDAIVITNHFALCCMKQIKDVDLAAFIDTYKRSVVAAENKGIKVLFGAEVRFTEDDNDYLIYGVNEDILSECYDYLPKGVKCYREEVKLENSVFIQAHPFRDGVSLCDPALLDGIESFNLHPGHNSRIGLAAKYANEQNFKINIAGSDFHHVNIEHEAVSALRTKILPEDSFQLADILKTGDYIFEVGENSIVIP